MTKRSATGLSVIAFTAAWLAVHSGPLHAQSAQNEKKSAPTVSGTWTMTVMSHQVGMQLTQDGQKVTGTLMMMGTDVPVEGEFVEGTLTLTSNARVMNGPPSAAEPGHDSATPGGTRLTVTAKLQDDGTLAGAMPGANGQPVTWIAERLKERKVKPAAASSTAAAGPGLTGAWKMTAASPQGTRQFDLVFKQEGEKVTGTLSSAHSGELLLEGTFAHGTLKFSTDGTGAHAMHLDYSATLKSDGSLAGELAGPDIATTWAAERAKK